MLNEPKANNGSTIIFEGDKFIFELEIQYGFVRILSRADEGFMAKLAAKWKGPAKVYKCLGPVNYLVSFMKRPENADTFNVQNLKPYFGNVEKVLT